ncbi:hypothetical protein BY996DRAFT_6501475 [Phakopsora pachyrhizi]|nr:hypothetical protein BY996DRAFT_6501475 [Phakopsora pachyrhizi]
MSNSQTKRELPKRSSLVENAFNRSITNVLKPIDSQTLSEAFPFATEAMIETRKRGDPKDPITEDPKLSIPPILIETLTSILKLYQSRLDQQNVLNDLLQSTISSKVLEISKMEKSIKILLSVISEKFSNTE